MTDKVNYHTFRHSTDDGEDAAWIPMADVQALDITGAMTLALQQARAIAVAEDPEAGANEFTVAAVAERNWAAGTAAVELTPVATWKK